MRNTPPSHWIQVEPWITIPAMTPHQLVTDWSGLAQNASKTCLMLLRYWKKFVLTQSSIYFHTSIQFYSLIIHPVQLNKCFRIWKKKKKKKKSENTHQKSHNNCFSPLLGVWSSDRLVLYFILVQLSQNFILEDLGYNLKKKKPKFLRQQ